MILHIGSKQISSWSMRAWLALKAAGAAFETREHPFLDDKEEQRRQWLVFSPTAQVPVLEDGAVRVWDSLAVCMYAAERYPQIWPEDTAARAWAYAAAAEMHAGFAALRTRCPFRTAAAEPVALDGGISADLVRLDALWGNGLSRFGGAFLAGVRFSAADAFYAPVVLRLHCYGLSGHLSAPAQEYVRHMLTQALVREWCGWD